MRLQVYWIWCGWWKELAQFLQLAAELVVLMEQTATLALDLGQGIAMAVEGGNGERIGSVCVEGSEFHFEGCVHALDLDVDQGGFGRGLAAEAPEGGGHFVDQEFFDGTGGIPSFAMVVDEELEIG